MRYGDSGFLLIPNSHLTIVCSLQPILSASSRLVKPALILNSLNLLKLIIICFTLLNKSIPNGLPCVKLFFKINENNLKYFYPAKTTRCKPYIATVL